MSDACVASVRRRTRTNARVGSRTAICMLYPPSSFEEKKAAFQRGKSTARGR
jgi:hypothetical protein